MQFWSRILELLWLILFCASQQCRGTQHRRNQEAATYLHDEKGFRKYPTQNWFSGITSLAYGWEVGRKHDLFHTKRLHNSLTKNSVIRVGPKWLSFASARAVKDIYGYNSPCTKGAIYASLQGGGKHLVNIVDRAEHSHRRRMVAVAYGPKNIDAWEPDIANSVARILKQMDTMCKTPLSPEQTLPMDEDLKFDVVRWSFLFSFETVVRVGLSKDLHFTEAGNDTISVNDKFKDVSFSESLHGGPRATSTLVWDTEWFPFLKKAMKALSSKYRENWKHGEDWKVFVTQLSKERMERYKDGEVLDDLFKPMLEAKNGSTPEIHDQDRIAEVDQMSK